MTFPELHSTSSAEVAIGGGRIVYLVDMIGRGQLSTVYRGVLTSPTGVRRTVALKMFQQGSSEEADRISRVVLRAASRNACVRHPNVVAVEECGLSERSPFIVAELVEGVSLEGLMARYAARGQRMPLDLALFIATETAEGLSGARTAKDHAGFQLGLKHLGLTPREVLLSWRGEVKVCDFELGAAQEATSSVRSLRAVAARASMMAPEIAQGAEGDGRSDVFALGILLRELLVGPRFRAGLSDTETISLARDGYIEPMTFKPHLPTAIVDVMTRSLEIDPYRRFPNATAMASELRRVVFGLGVGDGRWFLRSSLEQEWPNEGLGLTDEIPAIEEEEDDPWKSPTGDDDPWGDDETRESIPRLGAIEDTDDDGEPWT